MRQVIEFLVRVALLALIWLVWWWALNARLSNVMNLSVIVGGPSLVFPLAWLGRKMLDKQPTMSRADWVTTFVHFALGFLFGVPIIRAVTTHQDWSDGALPVPSEIGLALVIITGAAFFADSGKPCLKRIRCPLFHCTQSEIGGRLVVRMDAQSYGACRSGLPPIIGDLVSLRTVCALGAHSFCTSIACLRESV